MLSKISAITMCVLLIAGNAYSEHHPQGNMQSTVGPAAGIPVEERDPFGLSCELLEKTISDHYVSFTGMGATSVDLPQIEITGVMAVGDKVMATANVESLGHVTLRPNENIVVKSKGAKKKAFTSFFIKEITPSELIIVLESGQQIHGRFR
jgi:hypothetical protein